MPRYAYHDRLRNYQHMIRQIERIRAQDHRLALVAAGRAGPRPDADLPDGYPRGGDGGGHGSGVSNPTLATVEARDRRAEQAQQKAAESIDLLFEAAVLIGRAEECAALALNPPARMEPEQRRPSDKTWCVSCLRERRDAKGQPVRGTCIAFEPRTAMSRRSRDDLCSWCLKEWEASSEDSSRRSLPDVRLVMWRAEHAGQSVTERVRALVLGTTKAKTA